MATFEYVDVPADAVRLKAASACAPATKIRTELPKEPRKQLNEPTPALGLLLSTPAIASPSGRLLSTKDPLSVHIMTANFRRFVSKVGPVFWLQDRIEEIVLWKKGWKRTTVWLAAYAFFCYFPKMTLLIPHLLLLGVMLCYYPDGTQISLGEANADWQANIQAIQNLMGAFSDAYDAVLLLLPHLLPLRSPPPPPPPPKSQSMFSPTLSHDPVPKLSRHSSEAPSPPVNAHTPPHHPLLIATLLSFLTLLLLLMADLLPLRLLFFLAGAGTVAALHPRIRGPLSNTILPALSGIGPGLSFSLSVLSPRLSLFFSRHRQAPTPTPRSHTFTFTIAPRDVYLFLRRLIDNDGLDDAVWPAPHAYVELWENERWVRDAPEGKRRKSVVVSYTPSDEDDARGDSPPRSGPSDVPKGSGLCGTWSKAHLRPNERIGWTRARDGWSGVGGEVSSNLTFSLSPGWAFVETESWRPDLVASWAVAEDGSSVGTGARMSVCEGADPDGWTYTSDTWTHPRPDARPSEGWVTRRRRWVRRVYLKGVE